jgi:hypothetical protein
LISFISPKHKIAKIPKKRPCGAKGSKTILPQGRQELSLKKLKELELVPKAQVLEQPHFLLFLF